MKSLTPGRLRVGVFSGYDPRPWVMRECAAGDIRVLERFVADLRRLGTYHVVWPGERMRGDARLCYTMELADRYAARFAHERVDVLVNVHQTWTFPQLSQKVITSFIQKMRSRDARFVPRVVIASVQDSHVPGMVSGMATGGALRGLGIPYSHVFGNFREPAFLRELTVVLDDFAAAAASHGAVAGIVAGLHREHILEFGSFSLQMPTTRIDHEAVMARWGVSVENLDQQVFIDRALAMLSWKDVPGCSPVTGVRDSRVRGAVERLYDVHPEKFRAIPGRSVSRDTFAVQVAMYYAVSDIARERGATAVTIKCQDECSARFCTCCIATSFLGNDRDLDGTHKRIIPASCETDMPTLLTQLFLSRLTGKPAGFGDFRYVETSGHRTVLAIVNCGQHPVYFAARETDDWSTKMRMTDFPGQEHFYAAGGAAVRMWTAGGQRLTVARLGSERGRLYLAGTVLSTVHVPRTHFARYNKAWPIIEGVVPVPDVVLAKHWPSNHLGFVYGDRTAELIELAEQLGIGYRVWTADGRAYENPS